MGNSQVKLVEIQQALRDLGLTSERRFIAKASEPFKSQIEIVHEQNEDIVGNFRIVNAGYKRVSLTIGTQTLQAKLDKDGYWVLPEIIPMCAISDACYVTALSDKVLPDSKLVVDYDAWMCIPDAAKRELNSLAINTGRLVICDGYAH